MKEDNLKIIKKNSGINLTEGTDSFDIASTQDILSHLIDEKYNNSLAYSICSVVPLESSWGTIYTSKKKYLQNSVEIVKKDVHTKLYKIDTDVSIEAAQDMKKMYRKKASEKIGKIFSGLSSEDENFELIRMINNESFTKNNLIVNTANSGWVISQISQKVAESVTEMNKYVFRTLDSFCILPTKWAAYFLGTNYYSEMSKIAKDKNCSLFVGRYGRTDYYINPVRNELNAFNTDYNDDYTNGGSDIEYCYVGLKSDSVDDSSLVFLPYQYEIQEVTDPDTYKQKYFIYNRYSLTTNPLHTPLENNSMLHRFIIEEQG